MHIKILIYTSDKAYLHLLQHWAQDVKKRKGRLVSRFIVYLCIPNETQDTRFHRAGNAVADAGQLSARVATNADEHRFRVGKRCSKRTG